MTRTFELRVAANGALLDPPHVYGDHRDPVERVLRTSLRGVSAGDRLQLVVAEGGGAIRAHTGVECVVPGPDAGDHGKKSCTKTARHESGMVLKGVYRWRKSTSSWVQDHMLFDPTGHAPARIRAWLCEHCAAARALLARAAARAELGTRTHAHDGAREALAGLRTHRADLEEQLDGLQAELATLTEEVVALATRVEADAAAALAAQQALDAAQLALEAACDAAVGAAAPAAVV